MIGGRRSRPLRCRPTRRVTSDRASVSPTTSPVTARRSCAAATVCSGTSRRAARRRRRRRTSRSSDSAALTPTPVSSTGVSLLLEDGLPPPTGGDPAKPPGQHALHLRSGVPRRLRAQCNINVQRAHRDQLPGRGRIRRARSGRHMVTKVDINQAPPVVGVARRERQPPVHCPGDGHAVELSQSQSDRFIDYNGLLLKFQRRFANNFSFMSSLHASASRWTSRRTTRPASRTTCDLEYNCGLADYDVRHTFATNCGLRDPVGAREVVWRMAGQRHRVLARRPAAHGHPGARRASTGTGNRPNRICDGELEQSDGREVVRHRRASCRTARYHGHVR